MKWGTCRSISRSALQKLYVKRKFSLRKIAKLYHCDHGVIVRALRLNKIPLRHPTKLKIFVREELHRLYKIEKLSTYKLAKRYNCDPKTIYRHLKLNGITPRSPKRIRLDRATLLKLYVNKKKSLQQIAEEYHYSAAGILKKFRLFGIARRSISETSTKHIKRDFNGNKLEKAYLIGFRLGDLGVRKKGKLNYVSSGTTKSVQVTLIKSLFSSYGPVWISKRDNRGAVNISCALNKSFAFLLPKHANVPAWIQRSHPLSFSFLAGYTDAEGNFQIAGQSARFRLRSYDKGILQDLSTSLTLHKIRHTLALATKAGIDSRGVKRNGDCWCLAVASKEALHKLLQSLLPLLRHGKRKQDALHAMSNIERRML